MGKSKTMSNDPSKDLRKGGIKLGLLEDMQIGLLATELIKVAYIVMAYETYFQSYHQNKSQTFI